MELDFSTSPVPKLLTKLHTKDRIIMQEVVVLVVVVVVVVVSILLKLHRHHQHFNGHFKLYHFIILYRSSVYI